jgi:hypothetical protein
VREDARILSAGVHVVVGTPGRVYDMLRRRCLRADQIKMFTLDEADEMLSRGFKDQIYDIFQLLPPKLQARALLALGVLRAGRFRAWRWARGWPAGLEAPPGGGVARGWQRCVRLAVAVSALAGGGAADVAGQMPSAGIGGRQPCSLVPPLSRRAPPSPQVGVFSATLPPEALEITRKFMSKPVREGLGHAAAARGLWHARAPWHARGHLWPGRRGRAAAACVGAFNLQRSCDAGRSTLALAATRSLPRPNVAPRCAFS